MFFFLNIYQIRKALLQIIRALNLLYFPCKNMIFFYLAIFMDNPSLRVSEVLHTFSCVSSKDSGIAWVPNQFHQSYIDFELKKVLLPPPLGNFADISYLKENFKPHLLRDVCNLCSGALVSDSLLHMLL